MKLLKIISAIIQATIKSIGLLLSAVYSFVRYKIQENAFRNCVNGLNRKCENIKRKSERTNNG